MIYASNLFINRDDPHLNVFWQYNGNPELENNITKALINTFDHLNDLGKMLFIKDLMNITLPGTLLTYRYYLQTAPEIPVLNEIKLLPDNQKCLFAFSPTGKTWGKAAISSGNPTQIKAEITDSINKTFPNYSQPQKDKIINDELSATMSIISNKGKSIPDAWILIYENGKLIYCICLENKLYDLNPYQLNNHCQKSLFQNTNIIMYAKYIDILEELANKTNGGLNEEFLRYMYLLEYWEINNLSQLASLNVSKCAKYATARCKQILEKIGKSLTPQQPLQYHYGWMNMIFSGNSFNTQIGMCYDETAQKFRIPLYFAPKQKCAKDFYQYISINGYTIPKNARIELTFHIQNHFGANEDKSYCSSKCNLQKFEDYLLFWMNNINLIKTSGKLELQDVLNKMANNNIITIQDHSKISNFVSTHYTSKPTSTGYIVPEFGIILEWTFDQAQKLDAQNMFEQEIINKINEVYDAFNMPHLV